MIRKAIALVLCIGLLYSQLHVLLRLGQQEVSAQALQSQMLKDYGPAFAKAKTFVTSLDRGDSAVVKSQMVEAYLDNNFDLIMEKVFLNLPHEAPKSIKPIGYRTEVSNGKTLTHAALEYEYSDRWTQAIISLEGNKIAGFSLSDYKFSLFERTQINFSNQSLEHYVLLGLAIINLIFCSITLFMCIIAPRVKWRFLWILFILVGMGVMSFNWLEGRLALNIFSAGLPPARLNLEVYQPLFILLSIPLGAILFWMNFKKLTRIP
jgi:hypothetical protein